MIGDSFNTNNFNKEKIPVELPPISILFNILENNALNLNVTKPTQIDNIAHNETENWFATHEDFNHYNQDSNTSVSPNLHLCNKDKFLSESNSSMKDHIVSSDGFIRHDPFQSQYIIPQQQNLELNMMLSCCRNNFVNPTYYQSDLNPYFNNEKSEIFYQNTRHHNYQTQDSEKNYTGFEFNKMQISKSNNQPGHNYYSLPFELPKTQLKFGAHSANSQICTDLQHDHTQPNKIVQAKADIRTLTKTDVLPHLQSVLSLKQTKSETLLDIHPFGNSIPSNIKQAFSTSISNGYRIDEDTCTNRDSNNNKCNNIAYRMNHQANLNKAIVLANNITNNKCMKLNQLIDMTKIGSNILTKATKDEKAASPENLVEVSKPKGTEFSKNVIMNESNYMMLINQKSKLKFCPVCNKSCTTSTRLKIHFLTHTKEKPYCCVWPNCTKSFNVNSNMKRHLKSHTNPKRKSKINTKICAP